ncbi:MAG: helix-turn-helix domain-containing protein [Bacteroidia bacterium]
MPKSIQTFEDILSSKYGEKDSLSRVAFEAKAQAFYICEMLKEERENAALTQTELAEKAAMKKEFISRIENGKVDVQLSTFLKVLHGLGLKLTIVPDTN